ncbi:alcohol oxidase [Trichoderma austrokoningii]
MAETFDFIVVGGGTAGCLIAEKLASTTSKPSIALFEAGGRQENDSLRQTFYRFALASTHPELNYGSKSTPQAHCGGRQIDMIRGKGLGGSSQINFQVWSLGARGEFDAWAERTKADEWGFESILSSVKKIENAAVKMPTGWEKFSQQNADCHGYSGAIDVSIGPLIEPEARHILETAAELGYSINLDQNDGDPIGFGLSLNTNGRGFRTTSESAFLKKGIPNLRIYQGSFVTKIIFDGKRAIGVQFNGSRYLATKEVILTAGAIGSPHILLHSGVGPLDELQSLGIDVVQDLPGVGKGFSDHPCIPVVYHMGHGFSERVAFSSDEAKISTAEHELKSSKTGPLTQYMSSAVTAFLQLPDIAHLEGFNQLPPASLELLRKQTTPHFELVMPGPLIPPTYVFEDKKDGYLTMFITLMNPQSKGSISIADADPKVPPVIDPNYLSSPFDRAALKEATKETLKFLDAPYMKRYIKHPILAPSSANDEDIEAIKMGTTDDSMSCVDRHLKVFGLQNLRVADLSVTPLLPRFV